MSNLANMTDHEFESKKNVQAGGYTAAVVGGLLAIFFFVKWGMPPLPPPPAFDEGIEVNLGSSDVGSGDDQPFEPGPPAQSNQQTYVPPKTEVAKEDVKDIETDDKDEDAPVIKKPPVAKPEATKVPEKEVVKAKPVKTAKPVETPAPPVNRPKAVMGSVKGEAGNSGGNEAATYKKGSGEGQGGGKGDQGAPGGNPDSKNYTGGGSGTSGMRIKSGLAGRGIAYAYKYQDEFSENATIAVDVKIDPQGNVLSATYQLRGSTSSDSYFRTKAVEIVRKSKFTASPNGPDEQTGTVLVNFRVRG
jgi:hypothetical protein